MTFTTLTRRLPDRDNAQVLNDYAEEWSSHAFSQLVSIDSQKAAPPPCQNNAEGAACQSSAIAGFALDNREFQKNESAVLRGIE